MNKTDEHLNSPVQEEPAGLAHFKNNYCSCMDCNNLATKKLRVVHQIIDGYYCNSCASDLCWHGITLEDPEYER